MADDYRRDYRRRRSYFPSIDSRFMGALEPSPGTGSYYNPARYAGQGFSRTELSRIQRNLNNVYAQDLQYNRVANPRYQTTQDTGYSSTAQFGSGQASPATTQEYIRKYGRQIGGGLTTFMTPSGGSITYLGRPGIRFTGGAQPTVSPNSQNLAEPLAAINYGPGSTSYAQNYQKGQGGPIPSNQPTTFGERFSQFALPKINQYVTQPLFANAYNALIGNAISAGNQIFGPKQQSVQSQNFYTYNPSPVPQQPRRYFDF